MKKTAINLSAVLLCTVMVLLCAVSCAKEEISPAWENAVYTEDTTVGSGSKTVKVEIEAGEKKIVITLKTDKTTLGEALFEEELVDNASYITTLNGIRADYNLDNAYWAFYSGEGSLMSHGIAVEQISGGESYRFAYTAA